MPQRLQALRLDELVSLALLPGPFWGEVPQAPPGAQTFLASAPLRAVTLAAPEYWQ